MGSLYEAGLFYVKKIMDSVNGMKTLIMDEDTSRMVSAVITQTDILSQNVFLVKRLGVKNKTDTYQDHLHGIIFCRPTNSSISAVCRDLKNPLYREYHIFFTNALPSGALSRIAEADEHEKVRQVKEFFLDFFVVHRDLFSIYKPQIIPLMSTGHELSVDDLYYRRNLQGLLSCLLALKKRPTIRYQANSTFCNKLSKSIVSTMKRESELFGWNQNTEPVLLIMDRREDPLTPLLTCWNYIGMVHHYLEVINGRIDMKGFDVPKDQKQMVLCEHEDDFFRRTMFYNFGDLGMEMKKLVLQYSEKHKTTGNIQSIQDMQRFVDQYPEFRKKSTQTQKHVTLLSELSRLVANHKSMDVSQIEQDIAVNSDHNNHVAEVEKVLRDPMTPFDVKLRLVLIYALRYESHPNTHIPQFKSTLRGLSPSRTPDVRAVDNLLKFAGSAKRQGDLFGQSRGLLGSIGKLLHTQIAGCEHVYTQHTPFLISILEALMKNKLSTVDFPGINRISARRPSLVLVYIVGGATYLEAEYVRKFSAENKCTVLLGGSHMHSPNSFIKQILRIPQVSSFNNAYDNF